MSIRRGSEHTRVSGRAFFRSLASSSGLRVLVADITQKPIIPGMTPQTVANPMKNGFDSFVLLTNHRHVPLFSHRIDIDFSDDSLNTFLLLFSRVEQCKGEIKMTKMAPYICGTFKIVLKYELIDKS
uniref:Uncharacterized protein n=1 Tax=Solanum demissum TaxID=50514 RepID=A0A191UMR8_SOLDE|nr:hypothetical protein [Solanum demissum]